MTQIDTDGPPLIDVPVPHEERVERLVAAFHDQFGRAPEGIAEAPGRVNLIGEHVDYNDGLVLPFAIDRSVLFAWGHQGDPDAPVMAETVPTPGRGDYVGAVWKTLADAGHRASGRGGAFDATLEGDVPQGAGLSSSAAVELAVAGAFRDGFELPIGNDDLALLCQRAENEYVGVQCGIMDQFASALSKRDHALLIDCRTLAYRHVPLRLAEAGLAIVIANSAVRRELVTSAYNERRRECEEAVVRLREVLGRPELGSLRDVSAAEMEQLMPADDGRSRLRPYDGDVVLRRARHVVSEIGRVAEAVEALERDDFGRLGELMVESHRSLREDYEVSSDQLDLLVGLATAQEYVLGARLTGAGFGGCTVNLVRADRVEDFARDVIAVYRERTGLPAVMYVTAACDGLRTWRV